MTNSPTHPDGDPLSGSSTGDLVSRLSQQVSTLVRDELRLAQAEVAGKAKKAGLGVGILGAAGLVAFFGAAALVAAAIIGLAHLVTAWLAAVLIGVVLLVVAGLLGLVGRHDVVDAAPPVPHEAISGIKADIATVKEGTHR